MREAGNMDVQVGIFGHDDLVRWAADGSARASFADALGAATRVRFLRVTIGPSHGRKVERGLSLADVDAALRLASTPAPDIENFDAKRLILLGGAGTTPCGLVEAMIRTALDHDGRRLGLERRRGRAAAAGTGPSPVRGGDGGRRLGRDPTGRLGVSRDPA